ASRLASSSAARSRICAPIATPARSARSSRELKMPYGRFCSGKCESGATSTKERAVGSLTGMTIVRGAATPGSGLSGEVLRESLPAVEIILLELRRFERESRRADDVAALEHERERVLDLLRCERGVAGPLEALYVRAVPRHAVVQARAARQEAFRF